LISIFAYALAVVGLAILTFNRAIIAGGPLGVLVQLLATGLMIWARITFGRRSFHAGATPTEGGLVTTGPYRFIRHPIYASVLYFVWAAIPYHWSPLNVGLALFVTLCLFIRMFAEERSIPEKYPGYSEYAAMTKRIIPFVI
jgi:protein-S-isoprenylcysteine O-methyltransferase Ste14